MPQMSEAMAREILRVGAKEGVWEEAGQSPDSVPLEQALADAHEIYNLSIQAYEKGTRSDTILNLLFASQVEPTAEHDFVDVYAKHGAQPPAAANGTAPAEDVPPSAESDAPAASGDVDINSIYQGYDDQKAKDIVAAVKESAASGDLTPEEWAQIKAYEAANEERKAILTLEPEFKKPEPKPAPAPRRDPGAIPSGQPAGPPGAYADAASLQAAYDNGTLGRDQIDAEVLPLPQAYQGDEPILPIDITSVSDEEVSRLAMRFHSLEARTLWLVSQEEGRAEAAASLKNDAHHAAFARVFEQLKSGLEKQTPTAVGEARSDANRQADGDPSVVAWRNRQTRHSIEARSLKALATGYEKAAARLSREQSRRENLRATPTGS